MKMRLCRAVAITAALATLAACPVAAAPPQPESDLDMTNSGQHDPQLGALAFAGLVGVTDARFKVCGWSTVKWLPIRSEIVALAPQVFAKAGLSRDSIRTQMDLMRSHTLASSQQTPKEDQCVAQSGPPFEQRVLRSMAHVLDWGKSYLRS